MKRGVWGPTPGYVHAVPRFAFPVHRMRAVIQRVTQASVAVEGKVIGRIGPGLAVLLGAGPGDGESQARLVAEKIANLRIFEDAGGKMNRSVLEVGGAVLVVSQFTLYADTRKGRRPSFIDAAPPEVAAPLVDHVCGHLAGMGLRVATGRFGAMMLVEIHNDGPVTIIMDTDTWGAGATRQSAPHPPRTPRQTTEHLARPQNVTEEHERPHREAAALCAG